MKKILEKYKDFKNRLYKKIKIVAKRFAAYFNKLFLNIKEKLKSKKYITTVALIVVLNLLIVNLFISFSYYQDLDIFSIIKGVVGDINSNKYDLTLKIYLEDTDMYGNGSGNYYLSNEIPTEGYNYSGYKCQHESSLLFDDDTNSVSVTTNQKEYCSIYFDLIGNRDLVIKIMLEDSIDSNTYNLGEKIPFYGYRYSHYECTNNSILEYNSDKHIIKVSSSNNEYCTVYFEKIATDITLNLFVEETYQKADYIERNDIPSGNIFVINEQKSECKNNNNERIDTIISYIDGYIDISLNEYANCNIYLNIYE